MSNGHRVAHLPSAELGCRHLQPAEVCDAMCDRSRCQGADIGGGLGHRFLIKPAD